MELPCDYDDDPDRFAAKQRSTSRFVARRDVHPDVAQRFATEGAGLVADLGGGNGALARALAGHGVTAVVVDRARHVAQAPRPVVLADVRHLPLADGTVDGAAALYMLYHLPDPLAALREAHRVLRPGGLLAVSVPSRHNDPELAPVLPRWGVPLTFDAENGEPLLRQVFDDVEVLRWDTPVAHLPDRDALTLYLRGHGLSEVDARDAARTVRTPLTVTKRGLLAWARRQ